MHITNDYHLATFLTLANLENVYQLPESTCDIIIVGGNKLLMAVVPLVHWWQLLNHLFLRLAMQ